MQHILSVQDISCAGRCSQTVALPVLSVMGHRCSILPTAVLSTHTAFPDPYRHSLTADIAPICDHWQQVGITFDGVLVGYLADADQCKAVEDLLETQSGLKILDPAMGDHGKLYSGLQQDHIAAMENLCRKADILLPNVTEAALLTGFPYQPTGDKAYFHSLAHALVEKFGVRGVVITGVSLGEDQTGYFCLCHKEENFYQTQRLQKNLHGTGDLFSAVLAGGLLKGKTLPEAAIIAANFVEAAINATETVTPHGVCFEKVLKSL